MLGLGIIGVILFVLGIALLFSGSPLLGIILIALALCFGGGGYGYRRW